MQLIVNFKNYKKGLDVVLLAKLIKKYKKDAIIAVPSVSISEVFKKTRMRVYAQHVSPINGGRGTGFLTVDEIKAAGAKGTFLNHSEHRIPKKQIRETLIQCKKEGIRVLLFAKDLSEVRKLKVLSPYALAYEDPKLVSTGRSITEFRTEEIGKFAIFLKGSKILPICGAGIHSKRDIVVAKKLGCKGVAIASAIANGSKSKAEKFLKEIKDL